MYEPVFTWNKADTGTEDRCADANSAIQMGNAEGNPVIIGDNDHTIHMRIEFPETIDKNFYQPIFIWHGPKPLRWVWLNDEMSQFQNFSMGSAVTMDHMQ